MRIVNADNLLKKLNATSSVALVMETLEEANTYTIFDAILEALPSADSSDEILEIAQNGEDILFKYESDMTRFRQLMEICGMDAYTGYFDPEEDKRNNEVDDSTGYYYVRVE